MEPLEAPGGDDAGGVPMTEEQVRELFPGDSNVDDLDGEQLDVQDGDAEGTALTEKLFGGEDGVSDDEVIVTFGDVDGVSDDEVIITQ